jgi:hypothetical protein
MCGGIAMQIAKVVALLLCGMIASCALMREGDLPKQELKCTATNPWLCLDGHSCCSSIYPVCMGPDSEGYYCQSSQEDAENQVLFGNGKRIRAAKRTDE